MLSRTERELEDAVLRADRAELECDRLRTCLREREEQLDRRSGGADNGDSAAASAAAANASGDGVSSPTSSQLVVELQRELERERVQHAASKLEIEKRERQADDHEQRTAMLLTEISGFKRDAATAREAEQAAREELTRVQDEFNGAHFHKDNEIRRLSAELERLQRVANLSSGGANVSERLDAIVRENETLSEQRARFERRGDAAVKRVHELEATNASMSAALTELRGEHARLLERTRQLSAELAEAERLRDDYLEQLSAIERKQVIAQLYSDQLVTTQQRANDTRKEATALKQTVEAQAEQLDDAHEQLERAHADAERERREHAALLGVYEQLYEARLIKAPRVTAVLAALDAVGAAQRGVDQVERELAMLQQQIDAGDDAARTLLATTRTVQEEELRARQLTLRDKSAALERLQDAAQQVDVELGDIYVRLKELAAKGDDVSELAAALKSIVES